ncbi:hypothetical protein Tco_0469944, partial [Tanacetum coccineum]
MSFSRVCTSDMIDALDGPACGFADPTEDKLAMNIVLPCSPARKSSSSSSKIAPFSWACISSILYNQNSVDALAEYSSLQY